MISLILSVFWCFLATVAVCNFALNLVYSPDGFEDQDGFHYTQQPNNRYPRQGQLRYT